MGYDNEELRQRLLWIVTLRWTGILGVFVATHIVREVDSLSFSLIPFYSILGFAALYNLYFGRRLRFRDNDPRRSAAAQILLDQLTLALSMYFTGGCASPFVYFFIFHIVISGIILPWGYTFVFASLAVALPLLVMGLTHYGVLPRYGIFRQEPFVLSDIAVLSSYGIAFIGTIFLTAYFVTYLSRRLHERNQEVRRLYALSERLRSSIRIGEVISIIERELCGFTGVHSSAYMPLDKSRRVLTLKTQEGEMSIPLLDRNSFTEALLKGSPMKIDYRTISSGYEKEVLGIMGSSRALLLSVMAASLSTCFEYFRCSDSTCQAYGKEAGRCWQYSGSQCRGILFRNYLEKLDACLSCELFTPVGLYVLEVPREYTIIERVDMDACMRLLEAAGLAVSNALLYEKTLGLSKTDGLTGLKNHREFKDAFRAEFLRSKRYGGRFGVVMLDIDNFKCYNDTHGHPQGDILLKKVSDLIRENLKDTDIVARYGGEEFAVLMPETSRKDAIDVAERLRHMIEWYKFPKEDSQPGGKITVSVGVSSYPEDGENVEAILEVADASLYRAKRQGRNRVVTAGIDAS